MDEHIKPNIPSQVVSVANGSGVDKPDMLDLENYVDQLERQVAQLQKENKFLKEKIFNAALKVF